MLQVGDIPWRSHDMDGCFQVGPTYKNSAASDTVNPLPLRLSQRVRIRFVDFDSIPERTTYKGSRPGRWSTFVDIHTCLHRSASVHQSSAETCRPSPPTSNQTLPLLGRASGFGIFFRTRSSLQNRGASCSLP